MTAPSSILTAKRVALAVLSLCVVGVGLLAAVFRYDRDVLRPGFRALERAGVVAIYDWFYVRRVLAAAPLGDANAPDLAGRARPDVVVIVLDTLRRDRLALYGHHDDTMPALGRWAASGRVFTEARSTSSWTLPAHASLFTGRHPIEHGAHGRRCLDADCEDASALGPELPTLAGTLRDAGYVTIGLSANHGYVNRRYGLDRGFDVWFDTDVPASVYPPADRVAAIAQQILAAPRSKPLFLFVNFMDPHTPIRLRDGYTRRMEEIDRELLPGTDAFRAQAQRLLEHRIPFAPQLVDAWTLGYDGELRYLDEHLGRLLAAMETTGIDHEDLVLITSDHGEGFGEHDVYSHSKSLYDELTRIPLIVHGPGLSPGRDPTPVQLDDLSRWIVDAALGEAAFGSRPADGLQVMELYWARKRLFRTEAMRLLFDRVVRAYVSGGRKLFREDGGGERLYDLDADPLETAPLADASWAGALREQAERWLEVRSRPTEPVAQALGAADVEALRALGYAE